MANIEDFPPRYYQYLATQRRVSNWVQNTRSDSHPPRVSRRKSPIEDGSNVGSSSRHSRHRQSTRRKLTGASESSMLYRGPGSAGPSSIPPAVALLSSSLFICALLPSILTISAFVALLTLSTLESGNEQEVRAHHKVRKIRGPLEEFSS